MGERGVFGGKDKTGRKGMYAVFVTREDFLHGFMVEMVGGGRFNSVGRRDGLGASHVFDHEGTKGTKKIYGWGVGVLRE